MIIDFHSHILPRMDDGAKSSDMSLAMLAEMKKQGTDLVVATSHYYHHRESIESFLDRRSACAARLKERLLGEGLQTGSDVPDILLGAECAFYFGIENDPAVEKLCIEGTRTLLLEMPFNPWTDYEINAVSALAINRGLNVVIAHFERFEGFNTGGQMGEKLLALPVTIQINAETLLPFFGTKKWLNMFANGSAQLLGSDAHNMDNRKPNLGKARSIIAKKCGADVLASIDETGAKLLNL